MILKRIIPLMTLVGVLAMALAVVPRGGQASSHREAPLIANDPTADNTDLYAFVSPDRPDTVTIISNFIPMEEPAGGPNFSAFDDSVLYEIAIDNDGDSKANIKYQFRFTTEVRNGDTWLYNLGPISSLDDPNWNIRQFYTVTRWDNGKSTVIGSHLPVPPVNIGPRSTPNYEALAMSAVRDMGGTKVFAGQRDDPFFVDLGSIFDLGGLRPFNNFHLLPLSPVSGVDGLAGYNTHAIALQIPISNLTRTKAMPADAKDPAAVIGIYSSASRMSTKVLRDDGTVKWSGKWVQVSRLGNPLINEVVIPVGKKDYWNSTLPYKDGHYLKYYQNPSLAAIVNLVYPALPDAPTGGRDDLVAVLLTGVPTLNYTGKIYADLLRLNMAVPPSTSPKKLGVLEGDFAGFPNGRRLADDVTDIEIRAVACGYGDILAGALGLCNLSPNNLVGDGVDANDLPFMSTFPYASTPHQGYGSEHDANMVMVPNVVGMSEATARAAISAAGLYVSYVDWQGRDKLGDLYDKTAPGTVVSSWPAAGSTVQRGSAVTLGARAP